MGFNREREREREEKEYEERGDGGRKRMNEYMNECGRRETSNGDIIGTC